MPACDLPYKSIFSDRAFITDLITYFSDEPDLKNIDFNSLEKVNHSYMSDTTSPQFPNLVVPLIAFEQKTKENSDLFLFTQGIFERLNTPENQDFVEALATYIKTVLKLSQLPDHPEQAWAGQQEVSKMFYELAQQWKKESRKEGEHLGLLESLELLISQKFGKIPDSLHATLQQASIRTLRKGVKNILLVSNLDEFTKILNTRGS